MYYPEDLVEEVRSRNDIVSLIGTYVRLQKRGGSYIGLCPFHNEKTPSFHVSAGKQMYYCFGCGAGGNIFTFLMEYENVSFAEGLKLLADRAGISLPEMDMSEVAKQARNLKGQLFELHKEAAKYYYYRLYSKDGEEALFYLKERGLQDTVIKHFGLGYASGISDELYRYLKSKEYADEIIRQSGLVKMDEARGAYDRFQNRILFPIMDVNGKVIGFGGRTYSKQKQTSAPKYLNSPETKLFDKSRNLYGLNFARSARKTYQFICEGYMDVIALHQAGFTNAVASLGTAFTGLQARLLSRYTKDVILTYDSDEAGTKAALRAIPILKDGGLSVRFLDLTPSKDPDEFLKIQGTDALEKRVEQSINAFYFESDCLKKGYRQDDPEQKTQFIYALAEKLALDFPEKLERENYTYAVSARYGINGDDLKKLVNQYGVKAQYRQTDREQRPTRRTESLFLQSERLLLTWLSEEPELFQKIKDILSPDDFTEELSKEVAKQIFSQYQHEQKINPAKIISRFEEKEIQVKVADLFSAKLHGDMTKAEKKKAFVDTVIKIRKSSLEVQRKIATEANNIAALQNIIKAQSDLQKLHISLNDG